MSISPVPEQSRKSIHSIKAVIWLLIKLFISAWIIIALLASSVFLLHTFWGIIGILGGIMGAFFCFKRMAASPNIYRATDILIIYLIIGIVLLSCWVFAMTFSFATASIGGIILLLIVDAIQNAVSKHANTIFSSSAEEAAAKDQQDRDRKEKWVAWGKSNPFYSEKWANWFNSMPLSSKREEK